MQDVAESLGMSRQNFSNKIKRGSFYPDEIEKLAGILGCTVDIVFTDNTTGEKL